VQLFKEKMAACRTNVWMINTGWTGGPYGTGSRISIAHTRAIINAVLDGSLAKTVFLPHPVFGLQIPESCPGIPQDMLKPWRTWPDKEQYDLAAAALAGKFSENYKQYETSNV
jgi:phosphoenolpyruvate carboxykinase (ATP)